MNECGELVQWHLTWKPAVYIVSATLYTSDHTSTNLERKPCLLGENSATNGLATDLSPNHRILRLKNVKLNELEIVINKIFFLILRTASSKEPTQEVWHISSLLDLDSLSLLSSHTHTHIYIYVYIYIVTISNLYSPA
jgi:hypothetical protein